MPYPMRRLVVNELRLRDTFRIIWTYLNGFNEGEVSIPNFSHYTQHGEHAIRLRVLYRDNAVVAKAVGLLDQLVRNGDINEYRPNDCWCFKDDVPSIDREYCVLAFKCAYEISDLIEFVDITENNPVDMRFPVCFFHRFYDNLNIDLGFTQQDLQNFCTNNIQLMVSHSIDAISNVDLNREDFYNPHFFKRFNHMFCNNLLVQPDLLNNNGVVVNSGGESRFRRLFYDRNRRNNESEEETIERFCRELADV